MSLMSCSLKSIKFVLRVIVALSWMPRQVIEHTCNMNSTSIGPLAILYPGLLNFLVTDLKKSSPSEKNSLVKLVSLLNSFFNVISIRVWSPDMDADTEKADMFADTDKTQRCASAEL